MDRYHPLSKGFLFEGVMAKLPYFPFDPFEYITDTKIQRLNHEELGILQLIWAYLWINPVRRGHFLESFNGSIQSIPDDIIAEKLRLTPEKWAEIKKKLVTHVPVLKIGKLGEVYSKRLSNYKTKYELYEKPIRKDSETHRNLSETHRKPSGQNRIRIRIRNGIELELEIEEEYFGNLCKVYPNLNHEEELLKADSWHKAQPKHLKKKNHHKFLNNWFARAAKEKKNGKPTPTSKRLNPESNPESFGKPGWQKIPESGN